MFVYKVIVLLGLVQVLRRIEKPLICSVVYTVLAFAIGLLFSHPIVVIAIGCALYFLVSSLYFWLLNYFKDGLSHWAILFFCFPIAWFF